MGRQKKIKEVELKLEINPGESMSDVQTLENLEKEIDEKRIALEKINIEIEEKRKEQLKVTPMREVDADEMIIVKKQSARSVASEGLRQKIEQQKHHDNQMVTGKFINRRAPGKVSEKLTYMKYEDDPVKWYDFRDGGVYTIPRGFADQLNEHYYTPAFVKGSSVIDETHPQTMGSPIDHVDTSNKKYAFVPISF